MGRRNLPRAVKDRFWARIGVGDVVEAAALAVGVSKTQGGSWFRDAGGVRPRCTESGRRRPRLTLADREEIAALTAAGEGVRVIARELDRQPSTISRELKRGTTNRRKGYRASSAQTRADWAARRPKTAKLVENHRLREEVQTRLEDEHSPEQISNRLRGDFPEDPEMQVSHETIYQSIYVQSRGALRRDLHKRLRTGRALRKPRRKQGERRGRIPGMVNISERPAEAADRAVPGHWEGDLILGSVASKSAIGTVVERASRFTMLLHLPHGHGADAVEAAIAEAMSQLPAMLRKTLTWDQGTEMANHVRIAEATDLAVYFCDPHSPWQRGSNENTNGLLRQYFPKGANLSLFGPDYLAHVAEKLNTRPRKTLGWMTPAEKLNQLLSQSTDPSGVASTG